ncbi:MAG: hypothetical protein JWN40_3410 [Phycisphaerales bacterium]|nr:hypothetical protein [Phycisphaerales bacterium]
MKHQLCICLIALAAAMVLPARADSGDIAPVVPKPQPAQPSQATRPPPATKPASRPTLPPEFAVLQSRNVFLHGPPKAGGPGAPAGPEASFVLKGIVEAEARFTAFIEDKSAKRVASVGVGEAIALGRIKSINLDAIEYEGTGGATRRIEVGRNLMGEVVPPTPPTSKPTAAPPGGAPPGQPGGPPQPGQPGRGRPTKGGPQPVEGAAVAEPAGG